MIAPPLPMASVADRNAGRHLHDRQQRIDAAKHGRLDRHAQHRQARLGGAHPGQVRGPAGAGDDDLDARDSRPARRSRRADPASGGPTPPAPRRRRRARSSRSAACCIVSQSVREPMMIADPRPRGFRRCWKSCGRSWFHHHQPVLLIGRGEQSLRFLVVPLPGSRVEPPHGLGIADVQPDRCGRAGGEVVDVSAYCPASTRRTRTSSGRPCRFPGRPSRGPAAAPSTAGTRRTSRT